MTRELTPEEKLAVEAERQARLFNIFDPTFRKHFEERQLAPIRATPTPIRTWNDCCGDDGGGIGLADGWFVVIGGNPKFGKSLLGIDIAIEALVNKKHSAGKIPCIMSLEMRREAVASRLYGMMTGTPVWKLEKRGFKLPHFHEVWQKMAPDANDFALIVDDRLHKSVDNMLAGMAEWYDAGCDFFIVDYLQLAAMGDEKAIHTAVGEAANRMRTFARERQVPVIALSQFNRETSKDYFATPMPQGLHGGMLVEASADQILLIDHSRYTREGTKAKTFLTLTNRHGAHGDIPVEWDYDTLKVREADPHEEDDWPEQKKRPSK